MPSEKNYPEPEIDENASVPSAPNEKRRVHLSNNTSYPKPTQATHRWVLIDAKGMNMGRLSCEIVRLLSGKRSPSFSSIFDLGAFVIVINCADMVYKGKNKGEQTKSYSYSGYPGGLRVRSLEESMAKAPDRVLYRLVSKMLPKSTNRRARLLNRLHVYKDGKMPHASQHPELITTLPSV